MTTPNPTSDPSAIRERISPYFQTTLIIFTALVFVAAFYVRLTYFHTNDEPMYFESLTPQGLKEFGGFPEFINVGLHIDRFQEFDVTKNRFQFAGSVWFEFEAGAVSIETLENFSFERGTILYRSEPDTSLEGTRLIVRYLVRVAYNAGLIFTDFPLDDHRINLVLTHPFLSPEEVIFDTKTTDFIFAGNLIPFGWRNIGRSVKEGYTISRLTEDAKQRQILQPVVGFSLDIERYGVRYTLAILLPIMLIHFLMFFALSVETGPSVTIALGGITGILAYRYVIEQLSPLTGDLMLSDHFYFLFLTSSMLIFLLNKIDLFVLRLPLLLKKLGIIFIHAFTLSASLYLLSY
jgi:hypothetical protein